MARQDYRALLDPPVIARLGRMNIVSRRPMTGSVTGVHRSATRGSSVEFAEYRKYAPGDDLRRLDWRVYARTDRFYMKEFDADTNLRCMIFLDLSGSMAFAGNYGARIDYARRIAATLAYLLIRQGDAVGLWLAQSDRDIEIPARRAPSHLHLILESLQQATPSGPVDLCGALHRAADKISRRAMVIVLSDLFAPPDALLRAFQHMRFQRHDLALFHLLDPQELQFSFDRPVRFADLESSQHIITDPALMARAYRTEVQTYLDALQRGCREFHADYFRVGLDSHYEKALASFILHRQRRGRT